jgi:organic hydroperoxide reductase OsmC/OhrA
MMGTLAGVLAGKKIATPEDRYWAEVEGDIENVDGILKITRIRVTYHLKIPKEKGLEANEAFSQYLVRCPAAQSVIGCIQIQDQLVVEETGA